MDGRAECVTLTRVTSYRLTGSICTTRGIATAKCSARRAFDDETQRPGGRTTYLRMLARIEALRLNREHDAWLARGAA
jgi:hypothetical protein